MSAWKKERPLPTARPSRSCPPTVLTFGLSSDTGFQSNVSADDLSKMAEELRATRVFLY